MNLKCFFFDHLELISPLLKWADICGLPQNLQNWVTDSSMQSAKTAIPHEVLAAGHSHPADCIKLPSFLSSQIPLSCEVFRFQEVSSCQPFWLSRLYRVDNPVSYSLRSVLLPRFFPAEFDVKWTSSSQLFKRFFFWGTLLPIRSLRRKCFDTRELFLLFCGTFPAFYSSDDVRILNFGRF